MCNSMCNDFWLSDYIRLWPYGNMENANNNTKVDLLEKEQSHRFQSLFEVFQRLLETLSHSSLERSQTPSRNWLWHVPRYRNRGMGDCLLITVQ